MISLGESLWFRLAGLERHPLKAAVSDYSSLVEPSVQGIHKTRHATSRAKGFQCGSGR